MKIGLTYDLKDYYLEKGFSEEETAEFDSNETIEGIENALHLLGYKCDRIGHLENLMSRILNNESWDLIFNIAEGMYGFAREAQIPAILDAYRIPYTFSDPMVLSICLHKSITKRLIRDLGLPTPDFYVIENEEDLNKVNLPFPLFVKPISEGTGKGINTSSVITNKIDLIDQTIYLLNQYNQPVLIETFLPGREFTVGILGTSNNAKIVGVMEVIFEKSAEKDIYSFSNKKNYENRISYKLTDDPIAQKTADIALKAWRGLNCRDAGRVDLRIDKNGVPNFIEMNPLAGLHPVHSDLPILAKIAGMDYKTLIKEIIESAMSRLNRTSH